MLEGHKLKVNKMVIEELEIISQEELKELICWEKKNDDFSFYIFSMQFQNDNDLYANWKEINNIIAAYFQSNLKKSIEIWNIYLFFFVENEVKKEIRYEIEQDKYCSRKIIIDSNNDWLEEEKQLELINNKLFSLKIEKIEDTSVDLNLAGKLFGSKDNEDLRNLLIDFMQSGDRKTKKEIVETYLNKKEQI